MTHPKLWLIPDKKIEIDFIQKNPHLVIFEIEQDQNKIELLIDFMIKNEIEAVRLIG